MIRIARHWFQFRVATAVVVMLVAAIVLGFELRVDEEISGGSHQYTEVLRRGIPWTYWSETAEYGVIRDADGEPVESVLLSEDVTSDLAYGYLALDGVVVGLSLFVIALASERMLRR